MRVSRFSKMAIDLGILSLAYWLAFSIRFEWDIPFQMVKRLFFTWPYVVVFHYAVMVALGIPSFSWSHIGLREVRRILDAVAIAGATLVALRVGTAAAVGWWEHLVYGLVPFGVIAIYLVLSFLGIVGIRVLARMRLERAGRAPFDAAMAGPRVRTVFVGAGRSGLHIAREILARPELGIEAVGFLDDDPANQGTRVHGLPVLGPVAALPEVCRRLGVSQAIIASSEMSGNTIRRIKDLCNQCGAVTKIISSFHEVAGGAGGKERVALIRPVEIVDLLRREPVVLDAAALRTHLEAKTVLVTGAGGSIGQELSRQIAHYRPAKLVLLDRSENGLFDIHRRLAAEFPHVSLFPCLVDIASPEAVARVFRTHKPQAVYHAAAHKHVSMMEQYPAEAVRNNVQGTIQLANAAHEHTSATFVLISTDKAVRPSSVMGASKRVAEMYVQALSLRGGTRFVAVRFGNVLGSAGSVVPIFKEQIEQGGPITITHPEMARYFMTIPEASQLVLQAGAMGKGGEIFALDMGEPVRIVDLAQDMLRLSGRPPGSVEIKFTGIRPGEKLSEDLWLDPGLVDKTAHAKIFSARLEPCNLAQLNRQLEALRAAAGQNDAEKVREGLRAIVPEFEPKANVGFRVQDSGFRGD